MSKKTVLDRGELEERVVSSLTTKIKILDEDFVRHFEPNIIKVAADIRKGHDDAYQPKLLFIGPYHRKPSPMEEIKLLYLRDLLSRDKEYNKVSHYVKEILNHENRAREQYSDAIDLDNEEFAEMLVVDGCFIIEFLLKCAEGRIDPPISSQVRTLATLRHDLLLLENQIPFFILQTIFQNSRYRFPNLSEGTTLIDLALIYISKKKITKDMLSKDHRNDENIYHLLHLSYLCLLQGIAQKDPATAPSPETLSQYHMYKKYVFSSTSFIKRSVRFIRYYVSLFLIYFLCSIVHVLVLFFLWRNRSWSISSQKDSKKPRMLPSATELKQAGVAFKKKNVNCYLDVSFDDEGSIQMPLLSIQGNTNSKFRNFLAFEQSCPKVGNRFTSYVVLLDNLIDTSSDVALLKRRGVLVSKLGCDSDVAELFNQMRSGLCFNFDNHYLSKMFEDVQTYCNLEHNKWRAKLMHDYFNNPWACISIIAAFLLLLLTVLQTVYTIKSFYA